jgi:hypothetical protein
MDFTELRLVDDDDDDCNENKHTTAKVADAGWDPSKVYFNEYRDDSKASNINRPDSSLWLLWPEPEPNAVPAVNHNDDDTTLDPLGWPRPPEGFFVSDPTGADDNVDNTDTTALVAALSAPFLGDDEELLPRRNCSSSNSDDGMAAMDSICHSVVSNLRLIVGTSCTYDDNACCIGDDQNKINTISTTRTKEERIHHYITQLVDEESSVEDTNHPDDDDDEEWEDSDNSKNGGYDAIPSDAALEEDAIANDTPSSTSGHVFEQAPIVTDCPTFDPAALAANEEMSGDGRRRQKQNPYAKTTTAAVNKAEKPSMIIPLLKPPPEEKLKQWQDHKMRQVKHLRVAKARHDDVT